MRNRKKPAIVSIAMSLIMLIVDLLYAAVDPRIRAGSEAIDG